MTRLYNRDMALSFRLATEADIPALLDLQLRMATKKPWAIDLKYFTPVAKAVYLHDVNVDPRLQRNGIGRQLIERARAVAREWPVDAIRLDAYDGRAGAGPFYAKCGFTEVGRCVYRRVPLIYFESVLSEGR